MKSKNLFFNSIAALFLLAQSANSFALDINSCPQKMSVTLSNITRISKEELTNRVKELYNYSSDQDTSGPVVQNWKNLAQFSHYTMNVGLNSKEDHISTPYCLYLTGTAGVYAKIVEGDDRVSTNLIVSAPFGETTVKILSIGRNGVVLEENQNALQIVNYAHAGYEDGGYTATIGIGTIGEVLVK